MWSCLQSEMFLSNSVDMMKNLHTRDESQRNLWHEWRSKIQACSSRKYFIPFFYATLCVHWSRKNAHNFVVINFFLATFYRNFVLCTYFTLLRPVQYNTYSGLGLEIQIANSNSSQVNVKYCNDQNSTLFLLL